MSEEKNNLDSRKSALKVLNPERLHPEGYDGDSFDLGIQYQ